METLKFKSILYFSFHALHNHPICVTIRKTQREEEGQWTQQRLSES